MSPFAQHPDVGYTFVHVIPNNWGPHVDLFHCWKALARRRSWTHVISVPEFNNVWTTLKSESTICFILWDMALPNLVCNDGRRCKLGVVYSEALDEEGSKLIPWHLDAWHRFKEAAPKLDFVLAHTPWMTSMVGRTGIPAFTMPAGWEEAVMGMPRWDATKFTPLTYHGSMVGRRELIIPYLHTTLRDKFENISGAYGRGLLGRLDTAMASLYIAHSDVQSFSTWRLWQVASTSAVMIAEPGDAWPFVSGKHYFEIPKFDLDNSGQVVQILLELLDRRDDSIAMANEAHELARKYSVYFVEDEYIVPAAAKLNS